MKYLVVLLALPMGGCFFFYIPGSLFAEGNSCAGESAVVGQRLYNAQKARWGTIKELHGRSERCQDGRNPILVTAEYD